MRSAACAGSAVIGLVTSTCLPASSARMAISKWDETGVVTMMASTSGSERRSWQSVVNFTLGYRTWTSVNRSTERSLTATTLAFGRSAKLRTRLGPQYPQPITPTPTAELGLPRCRCRNTLYGLLASARAGAGRVRRRSASTSSSFRFRVVGNLMLNDIDPPFARSNRRTAPPTRTGSDHACGSPQHKRVGWNVMRDRRAGSHHRGLSDGDAADDGGVGAYAGTPPDERWHDLPVTRLKGVSGVVHRCRIAIVREANVRTDEHAVFDGDAGGNEGKRLDLDVLPQHGPSLNLHERRDLATVANLATVEIHLVRMVDDDILTELDVGRDHCSANQTLFGRVRRLKTAGLRLLTMDRCY